MRVLQAPEADRYRQVFSELGGKLWRAIYAYSGGRREIADDAVAEAFARAMEDTVPIKSPKSWLYKTAFRIAAAELRREGKESSIADEMTETSAEVVEVMDALRRLPPAQRGAIFLRYQIGMTVREVADVMGMSEVAVRVHLHRGRKRLRETLGGEEIND